MPIQGILNAGKVPVKIWDKLENVEIEALKQLENTSKLPFIFKHIAVMPDVHLGIGATVGSVVATRGAISPACVGVDLGCGMAAVKTDLDYKRVMDKLAEIRHSIERSVPVGYNSNWDLTTTVEQWEGWDKWNKLPGKFKSKNLLHKAQKQLGSLGGGNHFIEVCLDKDNNVWVMLHSGSRNVGKVLAENHINEAKGLMKKFLIELPDPDLAYLPEGIVEFRDYLEDLEWCQEYAYQNRIEMMSRVLKDLSYAVNDGNPVMRLMEVKCNHNYVAREHHFDTNVLVTRKGAVRARAGDLGIIPGSMGARSYIVRGLGNPDSFDSCSHGAGRKMSRSKARKLFTLDDLKEQTTGVECRKDNAVIDEIPGAYKDIDKVMENQNDLVEVVAQLKQVLCVKG